MGILEFKATCLYFKRSNFQKCRGQADQCVCPCQRCLDEHAGSPLQKIGKLLLSKIGNSIMTTLILISFFLFVLFFFWAHRMLQLKKFEKIAQAKRKQFNQDANLRRKQFRQKTSSRTTEFEKDIKFQSKNFLNELESQQAELEEKLQQKRNFFIQNKISVEYKEAWLHATIFWLLVFILAIYVKPVIESPSDEKTDTKKYVSNNYSLTIDTVPSGSKIKIMNIKPKYKPGILLEPNQYIIKIDRQGYASQCLTIDVKQDNIHRSISLKKPTDKTRRYTLTVKVKPLSSEIRIIGVKQKYVLGIQLSPSQYVMKVSRNGYYSHYQCVTIVDKNLSIDDVVLKKVVK